MTPDNNPNAYHADVGDERETRFGRWQFLGFMGILGYYGIRSSPAVAGPLKLFSHREQEEPLKVDKSDFTVVERTGQFASLEDVLTKGSEEIPKYPNRIKRLVGMTKTRIEFSLPSFMCLTDIDVIDSVKTVRGRRGRKKIVKKCTGVEVSHAVGGSCIILNQDGYFLTAHHVVEEFLDKNVEFAMLYNSASGIFVPSKILSYSKRYDLALGKINLPGDIEIGTTCLTKGNPHFKDAVFAVSYDPKKVFSREMDRLLFDSIEWEDICGCNGDYFSSITQKNRVERDFDSFGAYEIVSVVAKDTNKERERKMIESGQFTFSCVVKHGNSGLPVYSFRGDLMGIVTSKFYPHCKECEKTPDTPECLEYDAVPTFAFSVQPECIRELLQNYIEVCMQKKSIVRSSI